jgi:hypothetical protein
MWHSTHRGSLPLGLVTLVATGLAAATILSLIAYPPPTTPVSLRIEPVAQTLVQGETFTIRIIVAATEPVNAFTGELVFSNETLEVVAIDYNTTVADLWVEEPWYNRADNTLYFAGGTTKPGGFIGTDTLLSITLAAKRVGTASLALKKAQVLQHNGLGTEAPLTLSVDALFTTTELAVQTNKLSPFPITKTYTIIPTPPNFDLTGDGVVTFADVSIFLLHLGSSDLRYDFNRDGSVTTEDLTLLLTARTK